MNYLVFIVKKNYELLGFKSYIGPFLQSSRQVLLKF